MKYIIIFLLISLSLTASATVKALYTAENVPKRISVKTKKERFYYLVEPAVQKVYAELMIQYKTIVKDMKNSENREKIQKLKKVYKVKSDRELLLALKPHPQSIALAQAAMESAWATSRFFVKANNIFGVWSANKNEPRISAGEKRGGKRIIWLKKFNSIEESVREYYKMMGRVEDYKEFREVRYVSNDVMKIIKKLDKYSEIGKKYAQELGSMIRYNKLVKYDK
ncbi:MAG: glucosaminidase domain-containing protein [Sulfurimonas sp.]|nr:glucosaminidase domain-containing protein [Sulfurimonas sp.]